MGEKIDVNFSVNKATNSIFIIPEKDTKKEKGIFINLGGFERLWKK